MISPVVTRGFGSGGSIALVVTRGYALGAPVIPPVTTPASAGYWGGWLRKKKTIEDVQEALDLITEEGTRAEQERAARIESEALFARLARAERALTEAQRRRAESERKWALAVAQRIARDREDEEIALAVLLMD